MRIYAIAIAIIVSGCTSTGSIAPPNSSPPNNYRAAIVTQIKQDFFDPYSIRDASISRPLYASMIFDGVTPIPRRAWIVCLRANAKNRMGGYTGIKNSAFIFDGESIRDTLSGYDFQGQVDQHCKAATFQPFPEIEELT